MVTMRPAAVSGAAVESVENGEGFVIMNPIASTTAATVSGAVTGAANVLHTRRVSTYYGGL